jgi:hypothetical protein
MNDSDPSAERRPGLGPLQSIAEHTEQEIPRPLNEPECPEHISGGLLAEAQEGLAGELMADGTELITEAGEELLQEDRVARERADALTQLQHLESWKIMPPDL